MTLIVWSVFCGGVALVLSDAKDFLFSVGLGAILWAAGIGLYALAGMVV